MTYSQGVYPLVAPEPDDEATCMTRLEATFPP
jgi:hypothetical protein